MPKQKEQANGLDELRAWYLGGLRPKLARAVQAGSVAAGAVLALDRQLRDLLDVPDDDRRAA